jgi:tetratricopeptide (TPR) repeat protein
MNLRSIIAHHLHKGEEALAFAKRAVEIDQNYASGWDSVGWAYQELGMPKECAEARERDVMLRENDFYAQHGYLISLNELGETEKARVAALKAIPIFERHLRLERDDASTRAKFIYVLGLAQDHERAIAEAGKLLEHPSLDGVTLYNVACFFMNEHLPEKAMPILRLSFERGYCDPKDIMRDPDLTALHGKPEFESLIEEMEEKIARETNG